MNKLLRVLFVAIALLNSCQVTPGYDVRVNDRPSVSALVKLGDHIDQAISILRGNGYHVSDKYYATVNRDYWFATVDLERPASVRDTLYETWGTRPFLGKGSAIYVILESGPDGRIRKIH